MTARWGSFGALLAAALCSSASLAAQEPAAAAPGIVAPAGADSLLPFERPLNAPMRMESLTYRLSLVRGAGAITPLGVRTVEVGESILGGTPTWRITERRTGSAVATADSLWLTRADLTPLRWAGIIDRTQLAASFAHDSIFGAFQSYAGRTSFTSSMLPGVLVTAGMMERVIEMLPLRLGYRAAASLLLVDTGTPRALPAEITVEREERARTSAGDAECWVVLVRAGAMEERLWVDKARRLVVRTEQATSTGKVVGEL